MDILGNFLLSFSHTEKDWKKLIGHDNNPLVLQPFQLGLKPIINRSANKPRMLWDGNLNVLLMKHGWLNKLILW